VVALSAVTLVPATSPLRAQHLLQIRDQIVLVVDADRQPHHIRRRAGFRLRRVVELAVGGGGRVDDQRAGVADIGEVREQFQVRHQLDAGVVAAAQTLSQGSLAVGISLSSRDVLQHISRLSYTLQSTDIRVISK